MFRAMCTSQAHEPRCPVTPHPPTHTRSDLPKVFGNRYRCSPGKYSSGGVVSCTPCAVNSFNNAWGSATCMKCSASTGGGNTRGKTGSTKCTPARTRRLRAWPDADEP